MDLNAQPAAPVAEGSFSASHLSTVLARANELALAAKDRATLPVLRGKNIGLVGAASSPGDTDLLALAAAELGAKVAHVRPGWSLASTPAEVADTARVLGRLYDAIDISGASPELVRQVRQAAGVPVFDGIGSPQHPVAQLAKSVAGEPSAADAQRFVVQAVLLAAMA